MSAGLTDAEREALLDGVVITASDFIHNPNCGQVRGNRFLRKPREGDRLAKCCHRIEAGATPESIDDLIAAAVEAFRAKAVAAIETQKRHEQIGLGFVPFGGGEPSWVNDRAYDTAARIVRDLPT